MYDVPFIILTEGIRTVNVLEVKHGTLGYRCLSSRPRVFLKGAYACVVGYSVQFHSPPPLGVKVRVPPFNGHQSIGIDGEAYPSTYDDGWHLYSAKAHHLFLLRNGYPGPFTLGV